MPSEKILAAKKQRVEELTSELKGATTYVFVATRGLTVAQDTEMRNELRKNGVKYMVVKNTTLRLVFKELGMEGLDDIFKGPTAVAFSDDGKGVQRKEMMKAAMIKARELGKIIAAPRTDQLTDQRLSAVGKPHGKRRAEQDNKARLRYSRESRRADETPHDHHIYQAVNDLQGI